MCHRIQEYIESLKEVAQHTGDAKVVEFADAMANTKFVLTQDQKNTAKSLCSGQCKSPCENKKLVQQ